MVLTPADSDDLYRKLLFHPDWLIGLEWRCRGGWQWNLSQHRLDQDSSPLQPQDLDSTMDKIPGFCHTYSMWRCSFALGSHTNSMRTWNRSGLTCQQQQEDPRLDHLCCLLLWSVPSCVLSQCSVSLFHTYLLNQSNDSSLAQTGMSAAFRSHDTWLQTPTNHVAFTLDTVLTGVLSREMNLDVEFNVSINLFQEIIQMERFGKHCVCFDLLSI